MSKPATGQQNSIQPPRTEPGPPPPPSPSSIKGVLDRATQLDTITRIIASRIPGAQPDRVEVHITEDLPGGGSNSWEGSPRGLAGTIQVALEALATAPDLAPYTAPVGARANSNTDPDHPVHDLWEALAAHHGPEPATDLIRAYYKAIATDPAADSPLAQADDAKRNRDLAGGVGALMAGMDALMAGMDALEAAPWYPSRPGDLVHIGYRASGIFEAYGETYVIEQEDGSPFLNMRLIHHTADPDRDPEFDSMIGCYATEGADRPLAEPWFEAGAARITVVRDGVVIPHKAV